MSLSQHHISLLSKGPKFCPTTKGRKSDTCGDNYMLGRRMMIKERFHDFNSTDESLCRKPSKKYIYTTNKELSDIVTTINKLEPSTIDIPSNISLNEENALEDLISLSRSQIEIKKADKTNTIVIMNKEDYSNQLVTKCHLSTNSYEEVQNGIDSTVFKKLSQLCTKHGGCLTENERKFIMNKDWKESNFYVLPKINKSKTILQEIERQQSSCINMKMPDDLTSRPIVSGPKSVTKGISKILEKLLTPLVSHLRTYLKDERDFLRKFPRNIGPNAYIMCCDVIGLYSNIPNDLGLTAMEYWTNKLRHLIPSRFTNSFIIEGTKFVLENNYFTFNNTTWHQLIGTAMGKEVASPYACLTVGFLEETILFPTLLPARYGHTLAATIIEQYYRFVDDGITALPKIVDPEQFKETLNMMHPSIQFTITQPTTTTLNNEQMDWTTFLSLKIYNNTAGKIITDIHYKETNTHDYLHYDSHHPSHVKNNIPYCLAKTIIVSTSDEAMMEKNLTDLAQWLKNCGYPAKIIQRGIHNAQLQGPAPPPQQKVTIPFISTYTSNLDSSNIVDVARNLVANSRNPRVQQVFADVDFIHARRQPPNILARITNAPFITGERRIENGIFHCNKSTCKICKLYLQKCKTFTTNKGTWTVKCYADCNSLNAIYYQVCNFCKNVTNTGKTDNLRNRTNNHISGSRHGSTTNLFDQHNYKCPEDLGMERKEPYFKLYVFMVLNNYSKLHSHERRLHLDGHDTINSSNS